MRASKLYAPTLREVPAEAEIISHQLMLRAGMLRKVAAGIYTYLPLSWRTMKKIMDIIREEMDAIDGQELMMPAALPAELWQQSGRWQVYGDELWRLKDRHGRDFCLGPTHEECITYHFKNDFRSYKQLPQRLYQIQTKFRDERRPRFGLMRGREFVMKDMYSFDLDEDGLNKSYQAAYDAYHRIFSRCGLRFRPVEADPGAIGGNGSHEFMALADTGECEVLFCNQCDYAANIEFVSREPEKAAMEESKPLEKVATPGAKTVEDVAQFLGVDRKQVIKTLCYQADEELVLVLVRGDRQINEVKLQNALGCFTLAMVNDDVLQEKGYFRGSMGPVGSKDIRMVADLEVPYLSNAVCGANESGYHYIHVNPERDFKADIVADIRLVEAGEQCPHCNGHLESKRGIEVGQVFKLYTKYSQSMEAYYTDETGEEKLAVMGCYGIGVGRTMAAVIEQSHDENGIIWPMTIAPYHVVIIPVNDKEEILMRTAEELYDKFQKAGIETVFDDRKERPGVKFKDADLIGYPLKITIGKKGLERGVVELKRRDSEVMTEVPLSEIVAYVKAIVQKELIK